jgi:benzoylformate decarboxylase/acetolactate synthase-1/2/3 large subunit
MWNVIKRDKWCAAGRQDWARSLWPATEYYNFNGGSGGAGVGYTAPAAVGAALANRDKGIITVDIQPDGDLMYAPGVLWTAAHHKIPILMLMHNNRAYHQEVMHLQKMAALHNRRMDTAGIGTVIENPNIDFAKLAQSQGVWAEGPISDPPRSARRCRALSRWCRKANRHWSMSSVKEDRKAEDGGSRMEDSDSRSSISIVRPIRTRKIP